MIAKYNLAAGFLLIFLLLSLSSIGQDFKRQFRDAKELFRQEQYVPAMDAFKPLIAYDRNNPYSEYASYYYGLSALRIGFATVAKDIFQQIRKLYPEWNQLDEVNYFLAKIYFDQHDYFQAMRILKDIRNWQVTLDAQSMKRFYFAQVNDAETLRMLLEEYPGDVEVATSFARALGQQPLAIRDVATLDSLVTQFHLTRTDFVRDTVLVSVKKNRYHVSLLLPFLTSTLEPTPIKKRNQFVLDLYEGMKLAADTLERSGTHLDLYAYDTERGPEVAKSVVGMEELKSSDLLVGPLFLEQARPVHEFSQKNRINVVNPVSNNSDFLGKNPFALLYQPSQETLGTRSAELVAARVHKKNCIVYYGDTPKDSIKAFHFMKAAVSLGIRIELAEEINKETSNQIFTTLATPTEFDEFKNPKQFTIKLDSIGCLYVATDDPLIFTKAISGVETRGDSILVVGNESWIALENSSIDYSIFERLGIVLEAPNAVSMSDPGYLAFRKKYIRIHGVMPSEYARLGYEFIQFVGAAMQQYGVYFQTGLAGEDPQTGPFTSRYDYHNARDNQHVPYVYFRYGELKPYLIR